MTSSDPRQSARRPLCRLAQSWAAAGARAHELPDSALYRHGDRPGGARSADRSDFRSLGALPDLGGRADRPTGRGGSPRLARREGLMEGRTDLNSASIGIEIVNAGHDGGLPPFPDRQIEATDRARARHRLALDDPPRAGARPFRRRAVAQARSRRSLSLGRLVAGRRRPLGSPRAAHRTAALPCPGGGTAGARASGHALALRLWRGA